MFLEFNFQRHGDNSRIYWRSSDKYGQKKLPGPIGWIQFELKAINLLKTKQKIKNNH